MRLSATSLSTTVSQLNHVYSPEWAYESIRKALKFASVRTVSDAGHFVSHRNLNKVFLQIHAFCQVVQENPVGVANALAEILTGVVSATKAHM